MNERKEHAYCRHRAPTGLLRQGLVDVFTASLHDVIIVILGSL